MTVTSAPTISAVCAVSSVPIIGSPLGPVIYRVADPMSNAPHYSGPILAEGSFDFNLLLQILQYDPSQPFGKPPSPEPIVEVSVPLSVDWTATHYHGGQVTSAHLQGPPSQDQ